jgi:hypothetical protein
MVHALVSALSFELERPKTDFCAHGGATARPTLTEEKEKGGQLPLRIRRVALDDE